MNALTAAVRAMLAMAILVAITVAFTPVPLTAQCNDCIVCGLDLHKKGTTPTPLGGGP